MTTRPRPERSLVKTPVELEPTPFALRKLCRLERAKSCAKLVGCGGLQTCGCQAGESQCPRYQSHNVRMSVPPDIRNGSNADPLLNNESPSELFPSLHPGRDGFRAFDQRGSLALVQLAIEANPHEPAALPPDHRATGERSAVQYYCRSDRQARRTIQLRTGRETGRGAERNNALRWPEERPASPLARADRRGGPRKETGLEGMKRSLPFRWRSRGGAARV